MKERNWKPIETMPEGREVWTCIIDAQGVRMEQKLTLRGRLYWGGGVYVYYQPTHWSE